MKKYFEILQKCSLFNKIEEENLISMLDCLGAKIELFDKKYTIFAEGNPAKYIGIMLTGSAQIVRIDYYGNRSILSNVEPTEVFAEAFACAGLPSLPVTVIANEPCEVMLIDCNHILHTCTNNCVFHQQLIFNLMKDLASKAIMFQQKIEITSQRSTREKLMAYLTIQAKKADSNRFDIPFDRQELADYLEVDRSGLSAEISKLRREGIIENHRKHFILL
ncbi:MAG: Crp/Fnr family transcriptional regulator [Lachnospiraceae bacterium]|nr:Crp/Fnr family transcriptional regulator [Lachnospiraceae bacterium]